MSEQTELLHEDDSTRAVAIAYHAAANCVSFYMGPSVDSLLWPQLGDELMWQFGPQIERQEIADKLADYVRSNKRAPAESLYRYAHGQGLHNGDVDAFAAADMPYRVAYQVFFETLITVDDAIRADRERNRQREAAARGPVLAAALSERPEDTILEQLPDPLAKVGYARAMTAERIAEIDDRFAAAAAEATLTNGDGLAVHDEALAHDLNSPHGHVAAAAAEKAAQHQERRGFGSSKGKRR